MAILKSSNDLKLGKRHRKVAIHCIDLKCENKACSPKSLNRGKAFDVRPEESNLLMRIRFGD